MPQLAQLNIARLRAPLDDPRLEGFVNNLDRVNGLGDASPGFVWRLQTDDGDATALRPFPDPDIIVNLTVWESVESLRAFAYKGEHLEGFKQRRQWFEERVEPMVVLWWVADGHIPSVEEAKERLDFLRRHGPSPWAFPFSALQPPLLIERATVSDTAAAQLIEELNADIMPATLSIILNSFPIQERPKAIAIWAAFAGVGGALGPITSGLLLEHFWWGAVFMWFFAPPRACTRLPLRVPVS